MLMQRGAKVNVGDKYGTTALVWACRKGNAEIVDILLKAGANVDTAGMYSWTPLLVVSFTNLLLLSICSQSFSEKGCIWWSSRSHCFAARKKT